MPSTDPSAFEIKLEGRPSSRELAEPIPANRPTSEAPRVFEGPCRHFGVVLPSTWSFSAPLRVNNVDFTDFRERFFIQWPWPAPDSTPSSETWFLHIDGKTLLKGASFLEEMSGWQVWKAAQELLDQALKRRVDRDGFVSVLDGLGLPPEWRNGLVNDLFVHAVGGKAPAPEPSDLDGLLSQVELPGGEKSGVDRALDHLIGSVAASGADSGFRFDEEAARLWRAKIADWMAKTQSTFLDHPRVAVEFGWLAALGGLVRAAKGRKRQWLHLLPGDLSPEAWKTWVGETQAEDPGPWEVVSFAEAAGASPWKSHLQWAGAKAFLQLPEEALAAPAAPSVPAEMREAWGPQGFAFTGSATAEASGHCLRKPASWVALQAILERGEGFDPEAELRYEEMSPCTRNSPGHGADRLRTVEEITALRRAGINPVIGARRTLEVSIAPLVSLADGEFRPKAAHA